jgi:hypothetical protein
MEITCNRGSVSPLVQGITFPVWNYNPIFPRWADDPRIANSTVRAIHVPFKRNAIGDAISQFAYNDPPCWTTNPGRVNRCIGAIRTGSSTRSVAPAPDPDGPIGTRRPRAGTT